VRPFDIKGASGIIPKVKINYVDVATQAGQNKDQARNACEQVFRFLSDKVRKVRISSLSFFLKGEQCQMEIPYIGLFIVRTGIAAVAFNPDFVEETKGKTAKGHFVNKLFASSNLRHNLKLHDGTDRAEQQHQAPTVQTGGAMRMTGDAEKWLKTHLNISA